MKFKKGKFNPSGEQLFKSKMQSEAGYISKNTFLDEDGQSVMADIIQNGGQSEVQKRGILQNGAEYIILKIYFHNDEK